MHRKTKIGTEVAHVIRDSDTTFKVKRSKINLQGAGAYCGGLAHSLLIYVVTGIVVKTRTHVSKRDTPRRGLLIIVQDKPIHLYPRVVLPSAVFAVVRCLSVRPDRLYFGLAVGLSANTQLITKIV